MSFVWSSQEAKAEADSFEVGHWVSPVPSLVPLVVPGVILLLLAIDETQWTAGIEEALAVSQHQYSVRNLFTMHQYQSFLARSCKKISGFSARNLNKQNCTTEIIANLQMLSSSMSRLCFLSRPPLSQKPLTTCEYQIQTESSSSSTPLWGNTHLLEAKRQHVPDLAAKSPPQSNRRRIMGKTRDKSGAHSSSQQEGRISIRWSVFPLRSQIFDQCCYFSISSTP